MRITVNGEDREAPVEWTVSDLLARLSLHRGACAVEVNRQVVPRIRQAAHTLKDGDRVEIVTLVGGG